jgi:hypothetical protein
MFDFADFFLIVAIVILEMPYYFGGKFKFSQNIFTTTNFKKFKDDYSGNFSEILEKCKVEFFILKILRQTIHLGFSFSR